MRLGLCLWVALLFVDCSTPKFLVPPTGPGTDYPCGYEGQACGDGTCCPGKTFCNQYGGCTDATTWPVYDAHKMRPRAQDAGLKPYGGEAP